MNWKKLFAWWPWPKSKPKVAEKSFYARIKELDSILDEAQGPQPEKAEVHEFKPGPHIVLPGGVVFDPEEFKQFQKAHPEYSQPAKPRFKVVAHPASEFGVPCVGISLHGSPDPGPPKELLDELLGKKDGEK
jgi:hypothetical protein